MKVQIEYETDITWWKIGRDKWVGRAGSRQVATIGRHQCGSLCTTWFENHSDDIDNSVTGDLGFLQGYIQKKWTQYVQTLSSSNTTN